MPDSKSIYADECYIYSGTYLTIERIPYKCDFNFFINNKTLNDNEIGIAKENFIIYFLYMLNYKKVIRITLLTIFL